MTCGIYKITNTVTGEFYIGQSNDIEHRWEVHKKAWVNTVSSYCCKKLRQSVKTHGVEVFGFEILEECDRSALLKREKFWIDRLEPSLNGKTKKDGAYFCETHQRYLDAVKERTENRKSRAKAVFTVLRMRSGLSLENLANKSGVGLTSLERWELEGEEAKLTPGKMVSLCKVLDCSIEELAGIATECPSIPIAS